MAAGAEAGLASALEATGAGDLGGPLPVRGATAEQLALLPDSKRIERTDVERLPRGRGRPAGAKNRRTVAWRDYLASRYTHPLETLAAIQSTPADVLAAQLNCKPIEALAVIKSAAAELAPYMESKMPVGIAIAKVDELPMLVIEGLTHSREELDDVLDGEFVEYVEDQGLSDPAAGPLE